MQISLALLILASLVPISLRASEVMRVDFDDLPALVDGRNRHVSGARLRAEAGESLTGHLTRSYLPTIEAHLGGESFRTGSASARTEPFGGIEARLNLFRGGRDLLEERTRVAQVEVGKAGFQQARIEEFTKARKAYWTLVYQREMSSLLEDSVRQNQANLASANKRIRAGIATETDRIEFETYEVQLQQDLARMKLGSTNSERMLNVLLGNPADVRIETLSKVPHQHDESLLDASLELANHRDIQVLTASETIARNQNSQSSRWWTPSLDLYGAYSLSTFREKEFASLQDRLETVAGVKLTFTLFDGLQAKSNSTSLGVQAEGLAQQTSQTGKELSAQLEGSKQELKLLHDLVHSAEESIARGEQYLKRTQDEYARGVKNSPDMFSATEKYIDQKRRYAELRHDYQIAKAELLALLGK